MRVTPQALGIQPKPKPQPLVNRCRDCGRQISDNKSWCYAHLLQAIAQVASGEPVAAEIVHRVAAQSTSAQRMAIIHELERKKKPEDASQAETA